MKVSLCILLYVLTLSHSYKKVNSGPKMDGLIIQMSVKNSNIDIRRSELQTDKNNRLSYSDLENPMGNSTSSICQIVCYNGYGSETAKKLHDYYSKTSSTPEVLVCISMAEHGGNIPRSGNIGNLRRSDGSYYTYTSWKDGANRLQLLLSNKRYNSCLSLNTLESLYCIQESGYCPKKEWRNKVTFWYKLLYEGKSYNEVKYLIQ